MYINISFSVHPTTWWLLPAPTNMPLVSMQKYDFGTLSNLIVATDAFYMCVQGTLCNHIHTYIHTHPRTHTTEESHLLAPPSLPNCNKTASFA